MGLTQLRRHTFERQELPKLLPGATLAQVDEWQRRGIIVPIERGRFHRDDVALGAVILALQHTLGAKSPLVFEVAQQLRPFLPGWDQKPGPLEFEVHHDQTAVRITIPGAVFTALAELMDLL
jgi:hypothetical protein